MPIKQFNFVAQKVRDLQSWFLEIYNHLSAENYNHAEWSPEVAGVVGAPTYEISGWYYRLGPLLHVFIEMSGSYSASSAYIANLPFKALANGFSSVTNITDNSTIGSSYIEKDTTRLHLPNHSIINKTVVIIGVCKINGV